MEMVQEGTAEIGKNELGLKIETNNSNCIFHDTLGGSSGDGASVFSQRSAATKSSSATGKSGSASGGTAPLATGKSGLDGIPRAAIEGSAFVIPAQEVKLKKPRAFLSSFPS